MRLLAVAVAATLCASHLGAQGYRPVRVRSCPYADSLLGPIRDDYRSEVQGLFYKERDSTYLLAGTEVGRPPRVNISIKLHGERPTRDPAAQLVVYLRDRDARTISEATDSLVVAIVLDDSVSVQPAVAARGTYEGPPRMMVVPVSALIRADDLLSVTQAKRVVVKAGPVTVPLSSDERRSVRALLRVAICPP
ncbi:MAG: hypothetical protein ACRENU_02825 [Gemmatimonadaceae bacterium]